MSHNRSYFMHDQVQHRVRRLMGGRLTASDFSMPYRPILLVALGVLTAVNIMLVVP